MTNHIDQKTIVITGAGGGFGRLVAQKAAALGGNILCGDIDLAAAEASVTSIVDADGSAIAVGCDVTKIEDMRGLAKTAVERFGGIDVWINNAGIMPLAFFSDHDAALDAWNRCIDINFRGVMNGCVAAYDPMIKQGKGHIINLSSIYGNFPVIGAAVYGATKSAVNFLSESLRVEARGKIKVTIVKPTGVPVTGLSASVINPAAGIGIVAHNMPEFSDMMGQMQDGTFPSERLDPENIDYASLAPVHIADAIIYAMNQPWGVSIGDITVRASGDHFVL
jgi:NADP-dependent 3-hydroxy acid dehydrogenase YdfG